MNAFLPLSDDELDKYDKNMQREVVIAIRANADRKSEFLSAVQRKLANVGVVASWEQVEKMVELLRTVGNWRIVITT